MSTVVSGAKIIGIVPNVVFSTRINPPAYSYQLVAPAPQRSTISLHAADCKRKSRSHVSITPPIPWDISTKLDKNIPWSQWVVSFMNTWRPSTEFPQMSLWKSRRSVEPDNPLRAYTRVIITTRSTRFRQYESFQHVQSYSAANPIVGSVIQQEVSCQNEHLVHLSSLFTVCYIVELILGFIWT